jgi:hypothetical protein
MTSANRRFSTNGTGPVHGRYTTYTNHGCRCDACRADHARYIRERRHRLQVNDMELQKARHAALQRLADRQWDEYQRLYRNEMRRRGLKFGKPGRPKVSS